MRDGLSLLDQAIAFGGGAVKGDEVRSMIGTVGADQVYRLLDALMGQDGSALLQLVAEMSQLAADFTSATQELLAMLHQVALLQAVPDIVPDEAFDASRLQGFAEGMAPEDVQLFYQIGVTGQRELHLAPDPRSGFEMLLLRMLAFRPTDAADAGGGGVENRPVAAKQAGRSAKPAPTRSVNRPAPTPQRKASPGTAERAIADQPAGQNNDPSQWDSFVSSMKLGGIASQLAHHSVFESWDGETLCLKLDSSHRHLRVGQAEARLQDGIGQQLGRPVKLQISEEVPQEETPAMRRQREQKERQQEAETAMSQDPFVREMEEHFSAKLVSDSIRPTTD
jgi:DNA polymerase-3 subunit gamma/tau